MMIKKLKYFESKILFDSIYKMIRYFRPKRILVKNMMVRNKSYYEVPPPDDGNGGSNLILIGFIAYCVYKNKI